MYYPHSGSETDVSTSTENLTQVGVEVSPDAKDLIRGGKDFAIADNVLTFFRWTLIRITSQKHRLWE